MAPRKDPANRLIRTLTAALTAANTTGEEDPPHLLAVTDDGIQYIEGSAELLTPGDPVTRLNEFLDLAERGAALSLSQQGTDRPLRALVLYWEAWHAPAPHQDTPAMLNPTVMPKDNPLRTEVRRYTAVDTHARLHHLETEMGPPHRARPAGPQTPGQLDLAVLRLARVLGLTAKVPKDPFALAEYLISLRRLGRRETLIHTVETVLVPHQRARTVIEHLASLLVGRAPASVRNAAGAPDLTRLTTPGNAPTGLDTDPELAAAALALTDKLRADLVTCLQAHLDGWRPRGGDRGPLDRLFAQPDGWSLRLAALYLASAYASCARPVAA